MKAAIVGGTGYSALELIRIINRHPYIELGMIISNSNAGTGFSEIFPHAANIIENTMESFDVDKICGNAEMVFLATPSGISKNLIPQLLDKGIKCIDLSGDFRLKSPSAYEKWYKHSPAEEKYLERAVYGLSELYPEKIKNSDLIANPGCYPTASLLGLMPIIKNQLADCQSIIIDAKSGVSGAGRSVSIASHYAEVNENLRAYKLGAHQHIPEIEQVLGDESGERITISFSTHLVPMTRGIMSTIYVKMKAPISNLEVIDLYRQFYQDHPFVRIRPEGNFPSTKEVSGSNYCDIGLNYDSRTGRLTIVSVIDNLIKGASGQAIQNANLINGWDIQTGLNDLPIFP